ncbi:MAG: hypothetical protein JWP72_3341 [Massilia sp.]|nr:hypothetical protein [Massilia sp.]
MPASRLCLASRLAALLATLCVPAPAAARPSAPLALATRFALQMVGDRHWLELAGRASFALVAVDSGETVARVRIDQPAPGQFAQQQLWRERAMLDAAARSGARLRQVELASGARLSTLNKRSRGGKYMDGKYAGISVLSDAGRGLFVQWQWMRLAGYGGNLGKAGGLDAVQAAVWREVLPCAGEPGAS